MNKFISAAILICVLCSGVNRVHAQAKSAIGIGPAFNVSKERSSGFGGVLQGEIRLGPSFSLAPSIGVEGPYTGYIALGGRYYINKDFYTNLGAFAHVGGEDLGDSGIGGTAGAGFILLADGANVIDLNLHADLLTLHNVVSPLGGVRITYNFSFTKLGQ